MERWERWLAQHSIAWPMLETGRLDLSDDTSRQMARTHPEVSPIRELRSALSEMRLADLAVGSDGRNRTILSAFRARTGRCQPSNSRYVFGPSVWLRNLIQPSEGYGVAYIDWGQQEHGIAAALSGDAALQAAYMSGDPYLEFATGSLQTVFGWPVHVHDNPNPRSLRNFPMQGNGSEMLRLAACFATEQGIEVCALVHDAVLICAPIDTLDQDIERMQATMLKASRIVLDGFELRTDVNAIRYPDRYQDARGALMWHRVLRLIARHEATNQEVA
jgi:hypothetical protein